MASILTNASAMTALKSLTATNQRLDQTQARISTGYRVGEAADNAAYWSIATTMRSDNKALSTVNDALGLGKATVDVAYTALNSAKDVLDAIKSKLVAAKQPGLDRQKIQAEIGQLKNQLEGIASAASFSGSNWLSVNSSSPSYNATQEVVSSFARGADGSLSVGVIDIDVSATALFDTGAGIGLLEKGAALSNTGGFSTVTPAAGTAGPPATAGTATLAAFGAQPLVFDEFNQITFNIAVDGGAAKSVIINRATVNAALGNTGGSIANAANFATVINKALQNIGITGATAGVSGGAVRLTSTTTGPSSSVAISNVASSSNGISFNVGDIDIINASEDQLNEYISGVDKMAERVITAASDLGAVKSRIGMQTDFVKTLMDAIDRGIGSLVDADMNEESTKLQALQVQQQLGIQALSIANANTQSIMKLFQG